MYKTISFTDKSCSPEDACEAANQWLSKHDVVINSMSTVIGHTDHTADGEKFIITILYRSTSDW